MWKPSVNLPTNHFKYVVDLQINIFILSPHWSPLSHVRLTLGSACAKIVCAECTDLGQTVINNCCSQANPQQCFISRAGSGGNGNPYITTAAPDPNLAACSTALEYITECEAGTPGFSNLANSDEASCLCYDSTTSWDPVAFDNPWSSCIAWAKTADSTAYAGLLSNAGMCASVGNILNAPASAAVTSTTTMGRGAKATVTSAVATPASGSQSVVTATSSTAKSTSNSACSRFTRNIRGILGAQVSCSETKTFGTANAKLLRLCLAWAWAWSCKPRLTETKCSAGGWTLQ